MENLSTRKMLMVCSVLVILELICILIGACVTPKPTKLRQQEAINCVDEGKEQWLLPGKCREIELKNHETTDNQGNEVKPEQVVFSVKIPGNGMKMSRYFQFMLTLVNLRTRYHEQLAITLDSKIKMDIRVAYSNDPNSQVSPKAWKELYAAVETRSLDCTFDKDLSSVEDKQDYEYDCEPFHFLQFGSVPHNYYLINVRLTPDGNEKIGMPTCFEFITITQNGGFTKIWLSLKCVLFFLMFFPVVWYYNRIQQLERSPSLVEKVILVVAISIQILNLPLEFVTILCDASWMLLVSDIRQGLVYVVLLCFWLIFVGEHLMDQANRNKLSAYKYHMSVITVATLAMLSFELAERGMQIINPSATIWTNNTMAYSLLVISAVGATCYLLMLLYLIFRAVKSINYKRRFSLPVERRKRLERIVKRFYTLLFFTFLTALLTIVFFFLQHALGRMAEEWFGTHFEADSGFFTGVYGLWNIYVAVVLWLYSPSHKIYEDENDMMQEDFMTEQIQLMSLTQEKNNDD